MGGIIESHGITARGDGVRSCKHETTRATAFDARVLRKGDGFAWLTCTEARDVVERLLPPWRDAFCKPTADFCVYWRARDALDGPLRLVESWVFRDGEWRTARFTDLGRLARPRRSTRFPPA